ncbi:hypothetical protein QFC22_003326 [Naganishia vaughanmartiniae]|uniref:Uncharacterized protein n=1 Tax=Naganishia vaughanmartiniae TaxID=1424756 RepID=A0ACC2X6T8_9TREE|nr:hypothetical protein QFC22_003326 [Naganishia vaughanmartiniae]
MKGIASISGQKNKAAHPGSSLNETPSGNTTEDLTSSVHSLSASTISALSSSAVTNRPRTRRTLSRPKWLDVDANGGLLRRKTEPAIAAITVKGSDAIQGRRNGRSPVDPEMETITRLSSSLPRKSEAGQLDQVFRPPLPTTPSTGRRRTIGITSELMTHEEGDGERLTSEPDYVASPLHERDPLGVLEDRNFADNTTNIDKPAINNDTANGPANGPSEIFASVTNSGVGSERVVNADTNNGDTALNPSSGSSEEAAKAAALPGSTLLRWGTWVYSYAPTVRQPSSATPEVAKPEDDTVGTQPAPPLSDPEQQLMEADVSKSIGTVPESDSKSTIYSKASPEPEPGTQTEQGIGVDPQHRSEVPEGPDQGFQSGSTGAWSVSALASSAWAWGRGRDMTGIDADSKTLNEPKVETIKGPDTGLSSLPESSDEHGNAQGKATSDRVTAPSLTKAVSEAEVTYPAPDLPPPGWSGYVSTWLRGSSTTPTGEAPSSERLDPGDSRGLPVSQLRDEAETLSEQEPDRNGDPVTALVHQPANSSENVLAKSASEVPSPSRDQLSGINSANDDYLQQHITDTGRLSRTAWALAAASRWVGGSRSSTQPHNQAIANGESATQKGGLAAGTSEDQPQLKDEQITPSQNNLKSDVHRSQHASSFFTSAPSLLMTPELLEARPSPLLPSTATMLARPNLILPSFNHTFSRPPRGNGNLSSMAPHSEEHHLRKPERTLRVPFARQRSPPSMAWRALGAVSQYARGAHREGDLDSEPVKPQKPASVETEKHELPLLANSGKERWNGIRRVVIIGVHGWFPNAHVQKVIGAPRGSSYFASMMGQAVLAQFEADFGVGQEAPEKVTYIPLDGEGTVEVRVEKLYKAYLSRDDWVLDVRRADAIFVAAHSQGTIVAAHLLSRIIAQGHIRTAHNAEAVARCEWAFGPVVRLDKLKKIQRSSSTSPSSTPKPSETTRLPRIGLLAMCGVHQGPFYSTTASTVIQPYLNWFEGGAARELYEFQDHDSTVSKEYTKSLDLILHHGVKTIFLASLDDQMVPIYSAVFTAASHPLILRLLYVDAAIHSSTDFMINLIVFCLMLRNAGLDDQGLIGHLSEATAGAWRGAGHSTPYEDPGAYAFMVKYLLSTTAPDPDVGSKLHVEEFTAKDARNDYELPWTLRGVMDDPEVRSLFDAEISELKDNILDWQPTTRALKDIKKRLEPMAGRAALRQHQQKQRIRRTSSFLSLASSEGQASTRKQDESLSSSPRGEGVIQRKGQGLGTSTGKLYL